MFNRRIEIRTQVNCSYNSYSSIGINNAVANAVRYSAQRFWSQRPMPSVNNNAA